MEVHVNQAVNASVEDPVFIDASIVLRALVLILMILVTVLGESFAPFHRSRDFSFNGKEIASSIRCDKCRDD